MPSYIFYRSPLHAAGVCDPKLFENGRQFSAWIGLVPRQYSSGEKNNLGSITKTGDVYLRTMLAQGALSIVFNAKKKNDPFSLWIQRLLKRAGMNKPSSRSLPNKRGSCGRSWLKPKIINLNEFAHPYRPKQSLVHKRELQEQHPPLQEITEIRQ